MKKVICVCLMLFMCACSNKKAVPNLRNISFTASICCYNEMYECEVDVDNSGGAVMKVVYPEELSGLKFICNSSGVTAEYLGLSYTPDFDKMPSGAVVKTVYGIVHDCNNEDVKIEDDNGNFRVSGTVGERAYNLMITPSGLPVSAQVPDESYVINFKNVTLK